MASLRIACLGSETTNTHKCDSSPAIGSDVSWNVYVENSKVALDASKTVDHEWKHYRPWHKGGDHCDKHTTKVLATTNEVIVNNKRVARHTDTIPACEIEKATGPGYVNVQWSGAGGNGSVWAR
jgi:hypothetical protein